MKKIRTSLFLLGVFLLATFSFFGPAQSVPLSRDQVPEPLRPWIDWVLHDQKQDQCPFFNGREGERECQWPSSLSLSLQEKGGQFSQTWWVNDTVQVPLPGDSDHWPQSVRVDGQPASVVSQEEAPLVQLKPGFHTVTGAFEWDALPESLVVPPETGLLSLTLLGKAVDFPKRDQEGQLWLEKTAQESAEEDRLEIRVHRLLVDEIPSLLVTRILLDVSGKNREITLGKGSPEGFIPMAIVSPLPVRIEKDGSLKVQARPGSWTVEVKYRHDGPVTSITLPGAGAHDGPQAPPGAQENWAEEEIWAFEAKNNLRLVSVEGALSIDPSQTTLPDEWKKFPAYRLTSGQTLTLAEKRRGDSDPAPDQLTLSREIWLDFNGGGYTLKDQVNGTLNRSSRLDMNSPFRLGRVSVNGKDQLITHLPDSDQAGVELNPGILSLIADSRIPEGKFSFSAVGWNHDFQQVSGRLHLPPGWRIFSASGIDQVPETWIHRWTLLDLFAVLITALAFAKLWGKRWGLFALLTLVLTFTEFDAPQWIWLAVLFGVALLRVISKGWLMKLLKVYRFVVVVVLILISIPFMVSQLRFGLYPALERPYQVMEAGSTVSRGGEDGGVMMFGGMGAPMKAKAPPRQQAERPAPVEQDIAKQEEKAPSLALPQGQMDGRMAAMRKKAGSYRDQAQQLLQYQPGAKVQTGPGLPHWEWKTVNLQWSGPVKKGQKIRLCLLSPAVNLVLAFLRVGLLAFLILCVLRFPGSFWPPWIKRNFVTKDSEGEVLRMKKGAASAGLVLIFLTPLLLFSRTSSADFPPKEILDELRTRLLENPECYPSCASLSRMQVEVNGNLFRARLEASTQALTALPLPGSAAEWFPQRVTLDGRAEVGLMRSDEGHLWMQIPPGVHQILLEGNLPEKEVVQIALPLKPYRVEATASGWTIGGLHEDGQVDDNLQLTRRQKMGGSETKSYQANNLPPFVKVTRELILGLTWQVQTRITRLSPLGNGVVLEVPLIEGESVTTAGVRVNNGKVQVSMAPNAEEFEWSSVMEPRDALVLKSPLSLDWTEEWLLNVSPLWHVTAEGIPSIHPENPEDAGIRKWQPWPSEELKLKIVRPEPVEGPTMTVDQSLLLINPGLRSSEMTFTFQLRSSLGGQQTIALPEGAELQTVAINGATQPIRQDKNGVTLPVVPGSQSFELKWNQPKAIGFFYKTPPIDLKLPSVNSEIRMNLGNNRWVLLAGGPRMGPAVLFWTILIVLLLVAFALSRVPLTPLKTLPWILLGIGLSQVPVWAAAIVAGWLLLFGWRKKNPSKNVLWFDFLQLCLVAITVAAAVILFWAIRQGLLGIPEMEIAGNGSNYTFLRWFQDRSGEILPQPWVISLPMNYYRLAMLAWALWIAWSLLRWIPWGWECFSEGGRWRSLRVVKKPQ